MLFSGDNILGYGTAVIRPPDGNMTDYLKSLERLLEFNISSVCLGTDLWSASPRRRLESISSIA